MSLHAELTPEAQKRLADQQRNSTLSSIIIALLSVLLIVVLFTRFLLPVIESYEPQIEAVYPLSDKPKPQDRPELTRSFRPKPSAPANMPTRPLLAQKKSNINIPALDIDVPDPSADLGLGEDGIGNGNGEFGGGEGDPYSTIPGDIRQRCSKSDRMNRLATNGGNELCEEVVVKSLRWLKKTQNKDGSWSDRNRVAMTGFALLAYLGHCETPSSEEFGDAVTRAIVYLVNVGMKNGGKMADDFKDRHWCYDHAIAAYALAEAATFCKNLQIHIPNLNSLTKIAGDWILGNQHSSGSWDYAYNQSGKRGGDNSIGLWHIQALKACKHSGLWDNKTFTVPMRSALGYVKGKQASSGGIGYTSDKPNKQGEFTMTGGGMLAFQMWGKSHDSVVRKGADYIRKNAKFDYNTEHVDLYRHYYHAQAMMNRGGADWDFYNGLFRDQLLKNQNDDGTWKNPNKGEKINAVAAKYQGGSRLAVHYRTCLATLMLEVYYRFLPATGAN